MNSGNISLVEIANQLGISSSVLSNWQKRYGDFPKPSETYGRRRLYRLADVKAFMARHDLNVAKESNRDLSIVWATANQLRGTHISPDEYVFVVASFAYLWSWRTNELTSIAEQRGVSTQGWPLGINMSEHFDFRRLSDGITSRLAGLWLAYGQPSNAARKRVVRDLYGLILKTNDKSNGSFVTSPSLAALINKIGRGLEILDLTTGVGQVLNTYEHEAEYLWGRDINSSAIELQLLINCVQFGDPKRKLTRADSLKDFEKSWLNKFDVVICEPPLGRRLPIGPFSMSDIRWTYFEQANIQNETDWWIQTVLAYLRTHTGDSSPGPRGIVVTTDNWLYSASEKLMRTALIRRGQIEAVISLGGGLYTGTQVPCSLIVFRKSDNPISTVRLIDASAVGRVARSTRQLSNADIAKIVKTLNAKVTEKSHKNVGDDENQIIATDITLNELIENDAVLLPRRYRPVQKTKESAHEVLAEITEISKFLKLGLKGLIDSIELEDNRKVLEKLSQLKNVDAKYIELSNISDENSQIKIFFKNRQRGVEWDKSDFVEGDIFVCLTGPQVGECMNVNEFNESNPNWVRILQLRTGGDETLFNYLQFWLKYGDFKEQVDRLASGTTLRTLNKNDLIRILVPFPDQENRALLGYLYEKFMMLARIGKDVSVVSELLGIKHRDFLATVLSNVFVRTYDGINVSDNEE